MHGELSGRSFAWGGAWWNVAWEEVELGIRVCICMGWGLTSRVLHPVGLGWAWLGKGVELGDRACLCMGWGLVGRGLGRGGA